MMAQALGRSDERDQRQVERAIALHERDQRPAHSAQRRATSTGWKPTDAEHARVATGERVGARRWHRSCRAEKAVADTIVSLGERDGCRVLPRAARRAASRAGRDQALVPYAHRRVTARVRADPEAGRDVHVGELDRARRSATASRTAGVRRCSRCCRTTSSACGRRRPGASVDRRARARSRR